MRKGMQKNGSYSVSVLQTLMIFSTDEYALWTRSPGRASPEQRSHPRYKHAAKKSINPVFSHRDSVPLSGLADHINGKRFSGGFYQDFKVSVINE